MTDAMRVVKNLFKLGLVALQYGIVRLNLDTRSSVLRDFVKSETPKVEPSMEALHNMSIPVAIDIEIQKQEKGESDAPPYIGYGDNVRAYTRFELDPKYDTHKKYGPIK